MGTGNMDGPRRIRALARKQANPRTAQEEKIRMIKPGPAGSSAPSKGQHQVCLRKAYLFDSDKLHATVISLSVRRGIIRNRLGIAKPFGGQPRSINPHLHQLRLHCVRTLL
jgi:hypothetical protein